MSRARSQRAGASRVVLQRSMLTEPASILCPMPCRRALPLPLRCPCTAALGPKHPKHSFIALDASLAGPLLCHLFCHSIFENMLHKKMTMDWARSGCVSASAVRAAACQTLRGTNKIWTTRGLRPRVWRRWACQGPWPHPNRARRHSRAARDRCRGRWRWCPWSRP